MIARPSPFPEELDRSYLGRLMRLNGVSSEKEMVSLMAVWAGVESKSRREVSCLELLAKVADTNLQSFVRQQTTLPLRRAITSYKPDLPHGSEASRSMLWTTGMRHMGTAACFCSECVHEDLDFHGQSFWRRGHQIPGLFWCPQHGIPLRYVEDMSAFMSAPSSFVHQSIAVDKTWAAETHGNAYIRRYVEICSGLMDRNTPLDVKAVSGILKERALTLGYQTFGGKVKKPLISDAVIKAFGRKWLSTVLPELADKPKGELLHQMDGVLWLRTSASSANVYVLAGALLFETADAALNALQSKVVSEGKRRKLKIDLDDLINAYIQARGNYTATAKSMSLSRQEAAVRLQCAGLPNLVEGASRNTVDAVFAFYLEGLPFSQSAARGGLSDEEMGDLIRDAAGVLIPALRKMNKPLGRGSGKKRAKQLTPEEARMANGRMAVKFSPDARREKHLSQRDVTDAQKVAQ